MVLKAMPFSSLQFSPSKLFFLLTLAWFLSACGGEYSGEAPVKGVSESTNGSNTEPSNSTGDPSVSISSQKIEAGHKTYVEECSVCHGSTDAVMTSAAQGGLSAEPLTGLSSVSELTAGVENHPTSGTAMNCTGECAENVAMYINYAFVEPTHFPNQAKNLYGQQCASCHDGRGDLQVLDCKGCSTLDGLSKYIELTMPTGNVSACDSTCARETAKYILADFKQVDYFTGNQVEEQPLNASFTLSSTSGVAPLPVRFDATGSTGTGSMQYRWQVTGAEGFAVQFSGAVAVVNLTHLGNYTVTLVVSDQSGESKQLSKVVAVTSEEECPSVENYFQDFAWPVFKDTCAQCHTASGNASNTNLVYEIDDSQAAFNHILDYSAGTWSQGTGLELLMDKPLEANGITHGGYQQLVEGQLNYYRLENFAQLIGNKTSCDFQQNLSPTADFSVSPVSGVEPLMVSFDASSSSDPEGESLQYHWDFGNGFEGNSSTAAQIYSAGTYTATLTVTDSVGKTDSSNVTISVTKNESSNQAPVAKISPASPVSANVKSEIFFDGTTSSDDGSIADYQWSMGNGDTHSGASFNYAYSKAGTYYVQLIVTDDQGLKNSTTVTVNVVQPNRAPNIASIVPSVNSGTAPLVVSFSANVSDADNDQLNYEWSYNDQTSSSELWVVNFDTVGSHTVSLTVTDPEGESDTESVTIEVSGAETCSLPVEVFDDSAWSVFRDSCALCHTSSGDAYNSGLVYEVGNSSDQAAAFNIIYAYAEKTILGKPGYQLMLDKPSEDNGVNHSGGLQAVKGSEDYFVLSNFIESFTNEEACQLERNQSPVAQINSDYNRAPAPLMVNFNGSQSSDPEGQALTYQWDFGGGNFASGVTPSFVFAQGNHTVTLTVTDSMGKTDTATLSVVVDEPVSQNEAPSADASATSTSEVNVGENIVFDGSLSTDDAGIVAYQWNFDNGDTAQGMTTSYAFANEGTYFVQLIVTDAEGAKGSTTIAIKVIQPNRAPKIDAINVSNTSGAAPLVVNFDAVVSDADNDELTYSWSGQSQTSNAAEWSMNFASAGSYTVSLTVTDSQGASDTESVVIEVSEAAQCVLPSEEFADSTWPVFQENCSQCHTDSGDASDSALVYDLNDVTSAFATVEDYARQTWIEGLGYQLLLNKPALENGATHSGDLRLVNGSAEYYLMANLVQSFEHEETCQQDRNQAPTANINSDYVRGPAPLTVNFDAGQSTDPEGEALTYHWNFGNGSEGNSSTAMQIYSAGSYTVTLAVTDSVGKTDSESVTLIVDEPVSTNEAPVAKATAAPTSVNVDQNIVFDGSSSTDDAGIISYEWDFGNGDKAQGAVVNYAYTDAGTHYIQLVVTDAEGSKGSVSTMVEVIQPNRAPEVATLNASTTSGVAPLVVSFNASVSDLDGDALTYSWSDGQGQTSDSEAWVTNFVEPGTYTVSLKVTDSEGASDSSSVTIQVNEASQCILPSEEFADATWPVFQTTCAQCHTESGEADQSALVYDETDAAAAFAIVDLYAQQTWLEGEGYQLLLDKPALLNGATHGGNLRLVSGSEEYYLVANLSQSFENQVVCESERNEAPVAQISSDYVKGPAPLMVNFDASQSSDPEGSALTYEWDFGDNNHAMGVESPFIFSEGTHTVTLTVTDELGKSDSTSTSIVVDAPVSVNLAPTANAQRTGPVNAAVGENITFDASDSTDDTSITNYQWDFTNGDTAEGAVVTYSFALPGTYYVRLTVMDADGAQDLDTVTIHVTQDNRAPVPSITSSTDSGTAPLVVQFTAAANDPDSGDSATFEWNYDGQSSTKKTWALNFTQAGTYTVDLAVTDGEGAVGTTSKTITVTDPAACITTEDYFTDRTWEIVDNYVDSQGVSRSCTGCHKSTGQYDGDELIMVENNASASFAVLRNYVLLGNGSTLLAKTRGLQSHGGALVHPQGSYGYLKLQNIVDKIENPVSCDPDVVVDPGQGGDTGTPDTSGFWEGVNFLSPEDTLRKATLLFAGRLPTDDELNGLTEDNLRVRIRNSMSGENFDSFIRESTNDRIWTDKYAYGYDAVIGLGKIWGSVGKDGALNRQLAREPLQRMVYVVNKEAPYSEYLTGKYILVTPRMTNFFNYDQAPVFNDPSDMNEWTTATLKTPEVHDMYNSSSVLLGEQSYPHAGVLSSPMWLLRYQSTDSNRNRHRARFAMVQFLGFDIETLLTRSTDPAALMDTDNPTYKNPNCTGCHNIMDPVAGAFLNFKDTGAFRSLAMYGGTASALPFDYVKQGLFEQGDLWYRHKYEIDGQNFEGFDTIGFNGETVPTNAGPQADDPNLKNALSWLANEIIADERFKTAAVKFWYPAVFSQEPLAEPKDESDPNYSWKSIAYSAEQDAINEWASYFMLNHGNGVMNVKDLLAAMAISNWFRVASVESTMSQAKRDTLQISGLGRLLTPEQLHRKIQGLTDFTWTDYTKKVSNLIDTGRFRVPYGGQDSDENVKRARSMDSMKDTIATRMSLEVGCGSTVLDFRKTASERVLFPYVESSDTPDGGSGSDKIKQNIQYLYSHLLNQEVTLDSEEVSLVYDLFVSVRNEGVGQEGNSAGCDVFYNFPTYADPEYTVRSWMAIMTFFLSDFYFLYD